MSTVYSEVKKICRIGKKADKSDCAKKDCDNCRHWITKEVTYDCLKCMRQRSYKECGNINCRMNINYKGN